MGKIIIFIIALLLASVFVRAECIQPNNITLITQNTILCRGNYTLENGISIKGIDISLDCSNSFIEGNFAGIGIQVNGYGITIKNCNIRYFEKGIEARNSKLLIENTVLAKNSIGVYNIGSSIDYLDSDITDNLDKTLNISIPESQFIQFEDAADLQNADFSTPIKVPNLFSDEAIALLDLSGEEKAIKEDVNIDIFRQYSGDFTKYTLNVMPAKDFVDAKLFIYVPKLVAENTDYIILPQEDIRHDIVNLDPAQYVFYMNDIEAGRELNFEIIIKKRVINNADIAALVTYAKALKPWQNYLIITLFLSSLVLYLVNRKLREKIKEKLKHL